MSSTLPPFGVEEWLLEILPNEVIWLNQEGQIVFANKAFCERMGFSKSELGQFSIFEINPLATPESWQRHWELVMSGTQDQFKAFHRSRDGVEYEVEVFSYFFSNNGNQLICSVVNDISQSGFYRNLLNQTELMTETGGWKWNLFDGTFLATEEARKLFSAQQSTDLHPSRISSYFQEQEKFAACMSNLLHQGEAFDEVFQTKDSPRRFIRAIGKVLIAKGKVHKLFGAYQDVTVQKEREHSLDLFREVIDNATDLIYLYNRSGKLLHYSQSVVEKLGFSREELDEFYIYDLDGQITPEWWAGHFDEIVEAGSLHFEWLVSRKDGTKFPVDITANHLCYDGQDLNCAIIRDISERKQRELKIVHALEEIQALKEKLQLENAYLQEEVNRNLNDGHIISKRESYAKVLEAVHQVAPTLSTVLITGESGTGKELLAKAIHQNSQRSEGAFIKVNCATLPKDLIESELFGHKKGAFTGAVADKQGKFKLADGGTIFLDEIGELPIDLQPKLLRVLQEGEYDELGATKTTQVNVRVIAATNRNLEQMMEAGRFRQDLFYRLNVFPIHNIPLRERKEDIPLLAQFFLQKYAPQAGKPFKRLSTRTLELLLAYDFPGNIRELENMIERAVIIEQGTTLKPGDWIPRSKGAPLPSEFTSFAQMQKDYIVRVLEHTQWRVSGPKGAAKILDMNPKTLFAKMKKLGIEKQVGLKS